MAEVTNISWARSTLNYWIGCTKVSDGCTNCYASVSTPTRALGVKWGAGQPRHLTSEANRRKPLRWNELAAKERMCGDLTPGHDWHTPGFWPVFCSSLADVFDNEVPTDWRFDLFAMIQCTPHLNWLLLTKRIGNVKNMVSDLWWHTNTHVWLGATIVNQEEADRDIPKLLAVPAAKRFVSYEPALGPVDWRECLPRCDRHPGPLGSDGKCSVCEGRGIWGIADELTEAEKAPIRSGLDWIIVGGESDQRGMKARPFDIEWARSTVRQCRAAGVACFVKQLGSNPAPLIVEAGSVRERLWMKDRAGANPAEWPKDLRVQEWPR